MLFRILGPLEIDASDGTAAGPQALKLRSLLALLCVYHGKAVSTERLTEALWSGEPPRTAATALQVYVSKLRKHFVTQGLVGAHITTRPPGYQLVLPAGSLDLQRFETLSAESRARHAQGDAEAASRILGSAMALWRGPALEDLRTIAAFENIGHGLDELRIGAYEQHVELELALGRHGSLTSRLYGLIDEQPTWENLYAYLMIALYRGGRIAEALTIYDRIRRVLVEGLGLEPGVRLQNLQRAVLSRDVRLEDRTALLALSGAEFSGV
jgi:DNA-binding SARP family transcriptional activator